VTKDYCDFEEAQENIAQFIEEVYNEKRLHTPASGICHP
jgi:hypothetical protein